jgi:uncharacterized protein YjbI with pentapeptide repeats
MGLDFSNRKNLKTEELIDRDLTLANFTGADLSSINLSNFPDKKFNFSYANFSGADFSNADFSNANLQKANFTDAIFNNVNFTRANLYNVILFYANLQNANLSGCNLEHAKLSNANLSGINLSNLDLSNAYLNDANLSNANLTGANISRAILSNANLTGADLSNTDLFATDLSNANLSNANLSNSNIGRVDLSETNLFNSNLTGADLSSARLVNVDLTTVADLTGVNLTGAVLAGANLSNINLTSVNLTSAYLNNANLSNANLTGANLISVNFTNANLSNANFTNANFNNIYFTGANLNNAILPESIRENDRIYNINLDNPTIIYVRNNNRQPRFNALQVHQEAYKINTDQLLSVIDALIGKEPDDKYNDFVTYVDNTIGNLIRTDPYFESKRPQIITDYNKLLDVIRDYIVYDDSFQSRNKRLYGRSIDFAFSVNRTLYSDIWISENSTAYEESHGDTKSCGPGIFERFYLKLSDILAPEEDPKYKTIKSIFTPLTLTELKSEITPRWSTLIQKWFEDNDTLEMKGRSVDEIKQSIKTIIETNFMEFYFREMPDDVKGYLNETVDGITDLINDFKDITQTGGGFRKKYFKYALRCRLFSI